MYVRVLRPGETLKTTRQVVAHDQLNAWQYHRMGWITLMIQDGTVVALSEQPFDDDRPNNLLGCPDANDGVK